MLDKIPCWTISKAAKYVPDCGSLGLCSFTEVVCWCWPLLIIYWAAQVDLPSCSVVGAAHHLWQGSFARISCICGANTNSVFPIASESCVFIWRSSDSYPRFGKKICTYFICNLENPLFQVLSSTVSTQAMQRLTAGQGAMKIRPLGKVPHKYSKWRKK